VDGGLARLLSGAQRKISHLTVEVLGRCIDQALEMSGIVGEGPWQNPGSSDGQRKTPGIGLHDVAIDVLVVTESGLQHLFEPLGMGVVSPGAISKELMMTLREWKAS
jgi:hypothetical protein